MDKPRYTLQERIKFYENIESVLEYQLLLTRTRLNRLYKRQKKGAP
jgi:hypothetical protein